MPQSNTPSDGAAQPDVEAESRHTPAESSDSGSGASPPSDVVPEAKPGGGANSQHPHMFHLAASSPNVFDGGTLQGAIEDNWKILSNQQASVYLARLEPGGVREPHWHPSAWELNYVISGNVRWSFVGPEATHDTFEAETGDLVFAPQGHFHYFENASPTEDLIVLIIFNSGAGEPDDDVGIVAALSAVPPEVLGAMFKTSPDAFRNLPHKLERVTITRKP